MEDSEKVRLPSRRFGRYAWVLAVVWTVVVAASLVWNVIQMEQNTREAARIQARAAFEGDVIYRRWSAGHGGVYAPVTEETKPNPYLSNMPERDMTTPSGRLLTLINPAYMTRQVHELAEEEYGVRGHITSLNPIRPENAPDPWETGALRAFERGETETSSVQRMEGEEYMRLMRPLITEKGCLKCHAVQGYQEGDIRGGISVAIPMEPLWASARMQVLTLAVGHILLWLMARGGIVLGTQRLRRSERERNRANKELEAFTYSVSHDLRAPLRRMDGFSQVLQEDYGGKLEEGGRDYLNRIRASAQRMGELIEDLLKLSRITRREMVRKRVDLSALAGQIAAALKESEPARDVAFSIRNGLVADGDEQLLRVLLENLLGNAWKFTGKQTEAQIEMGVTEYEGRTAYFVRDDGAGFDMAYADKLFGVFQRLHSSKEFAGTGIGLATVQRIVHRHGGCVWAEGEVGKGATFYFTLET